MNEEKQASANQNIQLSKRRSGCKKAGCVGGIVLTLFLLLFIAIMTLLWFTGDFQDWACNSVKVNSKAYEVMSCSSSEEIKDNGNEKAVTEPIVEGSVIDIVEKTKDAVVSVSVSNQQFDFRTGQGNIVDDDIGTGFIIQSDGLIVTNQHVVSDESATYSVYIPGEEKPYRVNKILRDDVNDIAFLKIEAKGLESLKIGDSDNLRLGESVIAIGNPLGNRGTVTTGVISGLNRSVEISQGLNSFYYRGSVMKFEDVIQTDAAINPGNSGGPLINMNGEVIAINFATSSGYDNISFALPINRIKVRLEEYNSTGKFSKPYLGVSYQSISDYEAEFYQNVVAGALVESVVEGSPAEKAGILKYDIITKIGGKDTSASLSTVVQQFKVGEKVEVEVYRDGKTLKLNVELGDAGN